MELRPYQLKAVDQALPVLNQYGQVVLNAVCRSGKTLTSFYLADLYNAKKVLFITKKSALSSVVSDFMEVSRNVCYECTFINIESLHKVKGNFDLVIFDEYHNLGYIQKPLKKNRDFKRFQHLPIIGISATLFTETFSTAYSLFTREFSEYKNFYTWFKDYGIIQVKYIGPTQVNDYSDSRKDKIFERISKYIVSIDQEDAGFKTSVVDRVVNVSCPIIDSYIKKLKRDKILTLACGEYLADSVSQEFTAVCQLSSGTLKVDDDNAIRISDTKISRIFKDLYDRKIAIYYKYKAEKDLITNYYRYHGYMVTDDIKAFEVAPMKSVFVGQYRSKREGVKLDFINDIVFYSMPFSNLDYLQSKERILSVEKTQTCTCHVYLTGIEKEIYDTVVNHKSKFNTESYRRMKL